MFTKAPDKSRIRSKVTNNQENQPLIGMDHMFTFQKKRSELPPPKNTLLIYLLFPQKTEMTTEKTQAFCPD